MSPIESAVIDATLPRYFEGSVFSRAHIGSNTSIRIQVN
jgi:hypothetical protein